MRARTTFCLAMAVLLVAHSPGIKASLPPATRWADPSWVDLDVEFPGDGYHANWELFRCPCGDLLVRSELNVPGEVDSGETLLVAGKAVLSRGFGGREAELGASLDAPALMMQLGSDGVFVGSGIFKSENPALMAKAIVQATTHYNDPKIIADVSRGLGTAMPGLEIGAIPENELLATRGW